MAKALVKRYKLTYRTWFAAAHRIEDHTGKCRDVHGHTYLVEVVVEGPLNRLNMVVDVDDLRTAVEETVSALDHSYINEVLNERNTTMELIADWIMSEVGRRLPPSVSVVRVSVCESEKACATVEINGSSTT